MKNKMPRKALRALLAVLVAGCLCGIGCASASQTDWRALSIGVPLGWSADHFLSAQGLQVYRYDIPSQGVIAMQFGYIDALAVDDLYAPSVIQEFPQFTVMEEPIGSDSLVVQVTPTRQDLLEQIKAVEREAKADTQKVEEKLDRFITELPFKYTLKDDFVRTVARMENKLDKILDRLNPGDHP